MPGHFVVIEEHFIYVINLTKLIHIFERIDGISFTLKEFFLHVELLYELHVVKELLAYFFHPFSG